jgi:hypothetical protein
MKARGHFANLANFAKNENPDDPLGVRTLGL